MNDNLKGTWSLAVAAIKEECKIQGEQKSAEFDNWFDLEYVTCEENDALFTIKCATMNEFTWKKLNELGYIERLKNRIKSASNIAKIDLEPFYQQYELGFGADAQPKILDTKPKVTPTKPAIHRANTTLYSDYTFDNFVTSDGSSTNYAYKTALAVAGNPGRRANPILFYGGVGLGKTHLMNAIGNYIVQNSVEPKKVCYTQAESFLNEFTYSLTTKNPAAFKNKYRKLDVLLLDDIQFLQGKEGIQNELFYVFEELLKRKSQMVFACDRPLTEISQMEERLVSRLSGTSLDLQPPDFETRCAIIYKKLELKGQTLPESVVKSIATLVANNVRALEGALTKVTNYVDIMGGQATVELTQKLLGAQREPLDTARVSILSIIDETAKYYGLTSGDLKAKKRDSKRALARQVVMYLANQLTDYTLTDIGRELGGRDHSTVLHGSEKIATQILSDPDLMQAIDAIKRKVQV